MSSSPNHPKFSGLITGSESMHPAIKRMENTGKQNKKRFFMFQKLVDSFRTTILWSIPEEILLYRNLMILLI
jgi:hypothetical protein